MSSLRFPFLSPLSFVFSSAIEAGTGTGGVAFQSPNQIQISFLSSVITTDALLGIGTYTLDAPGRLSNGNGRWAASLIGDITVSALAPPSPQPNVVPLPASTWHLIAGLGGLTLAAHRRT
jgi:hypothetical protein